MKEDTEERIRVVVVAESAIARAGLEAAIAESGSFEVVGSTNSSGSSALVETTAADAILMEARTFQGWSPEPDSTAKRPSTPLTPREVEVLRMLADGASNKAIAWKMGISEHTVKFHVASILTRLNVGTRTEAVTAGVRLGLIYL